MNRFTERNRLIITGSIFLLLFFGFLTIGVKFSFGAYDDVYDVQASFSSAGQGLIKQSDVKIRGVNIGKVSSVELVDGRALVTMKINSDEKVPVDAQAIVRAKTLFGEKFVDIVPGATEATGPYLADNGAIKQENTLGGYELETVLVNAFPLLKAVDPVELSTVVGTLADGGEGLGGAINRSLGNTRTVTDVMVARDADTRQFLESLALLSDELAGRADDIVAGARSLNGILPDLNSRSDSLTVLLDQVSRLSGDTASLLDANRPFLRKSVTEGGKTIQLLFDNRNQIVPLLDGLRLYTGGVGAVIRYDVGDGTKMAAVKGILGGASPLAGTTSTGASSGSAPKGKVPVELTLSPPVPVPVPLDPADTSVTALITDLLSP